ncbi:MAG: cyclopropane-fatty-acyl-phospholipid synthase family protein, partial [Candidatus Binatia bacterium]
MVAQSEWWKPFYSGLWRNVQLQFWTPEQTQADADFIEQLLHLPPQANVLDIPCGEGRLSRALAARGYRLTGVDITATHLDEARRRAAAQQLAIRWEQRDMRNLPWQAEFGAAFCFWGSFGYFDDEENLKFVQAVFRALKPGGQFLLETHIVETLLPIFQERGWQQIGDTLILERRWYDYVQSRVGTE